MSTSPRAAADFYDLLGLAHEASTDEIKKRFRKLAREWYGTYNGQNLVLVTHGPPYGTKIDVLNQRQVGNLDFRKFIERLKPKVVICGHLHETAGVMDEIGETKIINPGWDGMVVELP